MQNARLGESKAGIKITKRNIDSLRYADDTMLLKLGPFSNTLTYTLILLFKNSSASILPGGLGCFRLLRHVKAVFSLNAQVPRKAVDGIPEQLTACH